MFPGIDRVYDNAKARSELGWKPRIDFGEVLARLNRNQDVRSALAREVGAKGYHDRAFDDGPYPVRE
jgi:UDP-glucose 4-epimerase